MPRNTTLISLKGDAVGLGFGAAGLAILGLSAGVGGFGPHGVGCADLTVGTGAGGFGAVFRRFLSTAAEPR